MFKTWEKLNAFSPKVKTGSAFWFDENTATLENHCLDSSLLVCLL